MAAVLLVARRVFGRQRAGGRVFAVLTKVGVYAILRIGTLFLGADVAASPSPGTPWLVVAGMGTLVYGALGVLASQRLPAPRELQRAGFVGHAARRPRDRRHALTGAALYYLVVSTLALCAFFLLVELVERGRRPGADVLAVTAEAFGAIDDRDDDEDVGTAFPATTALLGVAFVACAIMLAGLPPLAGFVGKYAMLNALFQPDRVPTTSWMMLALLIASGFATVIGMARAGVRAVLGLSGRECSARARGRARADPRAPDPLRGADRRSRAVDAISRRSRTGAA